MKPAGITCKSLWSPTHSRTTAVRRIIQKHSNIGLSYSVYSTFGHMGCVARMNDEGTFLIGELAKRAGVNRETIRFYERIGLLPKPKRSQSRYRVYEQEQLQRLQFIIRAKGLGFSLTDVAGLLGIADGRIVRCSEVRDIAHERLRYIDSQIADLEKLGQSLRALLKQCGNSRRINGCPIIDVLSD